jgi:hypothetical protein
MTGREKAIKAVAGALQPDSLDLTKYRQRGIREGRTLHVRKEEAAGALAFAAQDREVDGRATKGDTLAPLLLRLKYVDQHSKETFQKAHLILLRRHGWSRRKPSETMWAVAMVAIFEWVHDQCPECRGNRPNQAVPTPCEACGQARERDGKIARGVHGNLVNGAHRIEPRPGCVKCGGMGRIFKEVRAGRGMLCASCGNSGRSHFPPKERHRLVADYLATSAKVRGRELREFRYDAFKPWLPKYQRFLDALRAADKTIAAGIDLGMRPSHNRVHQGESQEEEDIDDPEAARPSPQ